MGETRLIHLARAAIITAGAAVNGVLITNTHNPIITYFIAALMTDRTEQP